METQKPNLPHHDLLDYSGSMSPSSSAALKAEAFLPTSFPSLPRCLMLLDALKISTSFIQLLVGVGLFLSC